MPAWGYNQGCDAVGPGQNTTLYLLHGVDELPSDSNHYCYWYHAIQCAIRTNLLAWHKCASGHFLQPAELETPLYSFATPSNYKSLWFISLFDLLNLCSLTLDFNSPYPELENWFGLHHRISWPGEYLMFLTWLIPIPPIMPYFVSCMTTAVMRWYK